MNYLKTTLAGVAALVWASAQPALASSTTSSLASDGASASVGSSSTSFKTSSDGSSNGGKAAAGDYKIIDVAAVADQPGTARLKLQALAPAAQGGDFYLDLPQQTVQDSHLGAGQLVTARQRAYGLEFADTETRRTFFLVLSDDWYRELQSNAVVI